MRSAQLQTFLGFHQFVLFLHQKWFHITFSHYILVSFDLWQFQHLLLFFTILTVLKGAGQAFCSVFPDLGLPDIFLMSRLGCGFSGKISQRWRAFSSHRIRAPCYPRDWSRVLLSLILWWRWCLPGFSPVKSLFFLLHMLYALQMSQKSSPLKGKETTYNPLTRYLSACPVPPFWVLSRSTTRWITFTPSFLPPF